MHHPLLVLIFCSFFCLEVTYIGAKNQISEKIEEKRKILESWAGKVGKTFASDPAEYNSNYEFMLESNELDGLNKGNGATLCGNYKSIKSAQDTLNESADPDKEESIMVEW